MSIMIEDVDRKQQSLLAQQLVDQARTEGLSLVGPGGVLTDLTKTVIETALEAEMDDHLGYGYRDHQKVHDTSDERNGTRPKIVTTKIGPVQIDVPRDQDGSIEPVIVRKRQRRWSEVQSRGTSMVTGTSSAVNILALLPLYLLPI